MSFLTDLTRMWLTRSFKPFTFKNEYDEELSFEDLKRLGLYIHIPFCRSICNFCPYCKVVYNEDKYERYIDALIKEIHMVGNTISGRKRTTSLYFGGGTPALAVDRLAEIIAAVREHFIITDGIGVELHPDNLEISVTGQIPGEIDLGPPLVRITALRRIVAVKTVLVRRRTYRLEVRRYRKLGAGVAL